MIRCNYNKTTKLATNKKTIKTGLDCQRFCQRKIKTLINTVFMRVKSGVGENRTLVQTSNKKAFYTFILFLGFR